MIDGNEILLNFVSPRFHNCQLWWQKDHLMLVQVELVLPKQVCRELLYGFAEKPIQPHYQVLEVTVDQMVYDHHEIMIMIVGQGND